MLIGDLVDTAMNLIAFAFIAAMVWLFVRPLAPPEHGPSDEIEDDARRYRRAPADDGATSADDGSDGSHSTPPTGLRGKSEQQRSSHSHAVSDNHEGER